MILYMEQYSNLECFQGDYAQVAVTIRSRYKWGLIDRMGKEVGKPSVKYISSQISPTLIKFIRVEQS